MIYCLYEGSTRDVWSNIPLRLQEFPWASPSGTPSGNGIYLTVYPSSLIGIACHVEQQSLLAYYAVY